MTSKGKNMIVPFFDYQKAFKAVEPDFVDVFRDIIHRGAFIMQKDLIEFEKKLADFLEVKYAFGVGNATDGLMLAWKAADLKPGDEVICPSHTMVATAASVALAGGVPVLVDCDEDHLVDPDAMAAAVTPRTRGLMPVQLNGRTCRMDRIKKIADKHGLIIIEDAAQALGSKYRGQFAGTFGLAAAISFYPAKVLGCLGDGGAVVTNDDETAVKLEMLRDHGRASDGEIVMWGHNSRLDNLQAALLHLQFENYDSIVKRRRQIAATYQEMLEDIHQLVLPPGPNSDPDHFDVFQNYEIEAERRDKLKVFLAENGIGTLIQWGGKAVHQFKKLGFNVALPKTEMMFERCLMLPMNITLENEDITYVCEKVREFYEA